LFPHDLPQRIPSGILKLLIWNGNGEVLSNKNDSFWIEFFPSLPQKKVRKMRERLNFFCMKFRKIVLRFSFEMELIFRENSSDLFWKKKIGKIFHDKKINKILKKFC